MWFVLSMVNDEALDPHGCGLEAMASASIRGRIAEGSNAGQRVKTAGSDPDGDRRGEDFESGGSRCAMVSGFSVHAGVGIRAGQRKVLDKLCRYMARPPLANERLSKLPV